MRRDVGAARFPNRPRPVLIYSHGEACQRTGRRTIGQRSSALDAVAELVYAERDGQAKDEADDRMLAQKPLD